MGGGATARPLYGSTTVGRPCGSATARWPCGRGACGGGEGLSHGGRAAGAIFAKKKIDNSYFCKYETKRSQYDQKFHAYSVTYMEAVKLDALSVILGHGVVTHRKVVKGYTRTYVLGLIRP